MKSPFIFICALLFIMNVNGQNTVWVKQGKAPKTERGNDIAHDNNGNLYITGSFQDSVRFDTILLTEQYGTYCAKYDTTGKLIWAYKNMGESGVSFDGTSSIYLFSNFTKSLQKVSLNGSLVWNKSLFSSSNNGSCGIQDVYVKDSGVYVTGFYSGNAIFATDTLYNTSANWDIFIAKFNSAGVFQWAKTAGGNGLDKGYGIYVNNSNEVYSVGYFKDTANFGTTQLISNGLQDMYLAKYSNTGSFLWVKKYGGTGFDLAAKIIADNNNFIYTTGRYYNSISFGTTTLSGSNTNAFIAKFDSNGNPVWAKSISGTGDDEEGDIDYENGKLSFIATTSGNVTLGTSNITGLGSLDICIGSVDTAGLVLWSKLLGGSSDDEGSGVSLYNGSTYFNGSFKTTANFSNLQLTSQGQWDIVTGKIDNQIINNILQTKLTDNQISIFPNPGNGNITINLSNNIKNYTLSIINIIGETVFRQSITSQTTNVNLNLKPGLYFAVIDNNHIKTTKKIIIE